MCSSRINGGELRGQPANPGSPGKMAVKTVHVCLLQPLIQVSPGQLALEMYDSYSTCITTINITVIPIPCDHFPSFPMIHSITWLHVQVGHILIHNFLPGFLVLYRLTITPLHLIPYNSVCVMPFPSNHQLVLDQLTLIPFTSSFLITSSLSTISIKSSIYSSSQGKPTQNQVVPEERPSSVF